MVLERTSVGAASDLLRGIDPVVELRGFEPLTSCMPSRLHQRTGPTAVFARPG